MEDDDFGRLGFVGRRHGWKIEDRDKGNGEGASNYRRQPPYLDAGEPIFVSSADTRT